MSVDWSKFDGKYWKPEQGKTVLVVLSNWRSEQKIFGAQENNPKWALVFDVERVDDKEYAPHLEWSTTSLSAVQDFKSIIERAESRGLKYIKVIIKRDLENKYSIIDYPGV